MNAPNSSASRGHLSTEGRHPAAADLDRLSTLEALALFSMADREAAQAVESAREQLAAVVDLVAERLARGGRLFYVGAGTSGRLAVLDAAECPPTFLSNPESVQAILAGGTPALTAAVEGAEDSVSEGSARVDECGVGPEDVVLGITAGGTTPFVHAALGRARALGAKTVFLTCVPAEQVPSPADLCIRLLTGPELVSGSTRLKAGTATKLALNALSTLVMVRLGKVYGDLMVDVNTRGNAKLTDRGERILMTLLDVQRREASGLLVQAEGRVKVAVLMHRRDMDRAAAVQCLAGAGGSLRDALDRVSG